MNPMGQDQSSVQDSDSGTLKTLPETTCRFHFLSEIFHGSHFPKFVQAILIPLKESCH